MVGGEIAQRSKEKFYRGIEVEELKKMDLREFARLVKSRARRYILRNQNVLESFVQKCERNAAKKKAIKTHGRELIIVPKMVGHTLQIYNGKEFIKVEVIPDMLGHRFGEFSLTRKIAKHTKVGIKPVRKG